MKEDIAWDETDFVARSKEARKRLCEGLAVLSSMPGAPKRLKSKEFVDALMNFMFQVLEKNRVFNLTTITDPVDFVELHFLDSLSAGLLPEVLASNDIVDMGAGAGFPGMPIALLFPEKRVVLADAINKRVDFMNSVAREMELSEVTAIHVRAEIVGHDFFYRESFDVALCRAVASLPVALEYTMPLVRVGGVGVFYKSMYSEEEIKESRMACSLLGAGKDVQIVASKKLLPSRAHALYVIRKERKTPDTYPRRDGKPKKAPL